MYKCIHYVIKNKEIEDKTYNKINIQTVVTVFVDLCGVAVYGQVRSTMCAIALSVPQVKEAGQGHGLNSK